jgi:hypothetical protein
MCYELDMTSAGRKNEGQNEAEKGQIEAEKYRKSGVFAHFEAEKSQIEAEKYRKSGRFCAFPPLFGRLMGAPEALEMDQEPGAVIRLYQELITPSEPAPALPTMHFRGPGSPATGRA